MGDEINDNGVEKIFLIILGPEQLKSLNHARALEVCLKITAYLATVLASRTTDLHLFENRKQRFRVYQKSGLSAVTF